MIRKRYLSLLLSLLLLFALIPNAAFAADDPQTPESTEPPCVPETETAEPLCAPVPDAIEIKPVLPAEAGEGGEVPAFVGGYVREDNGEANPDRYPFAEQSDDYAPAHRGTLPDSYRLNTTPIKNQGLSLIHI